MNKFTQKLIAIVVLLLVLVIGLSLISGLVEERQSLQSQVQDDIARSSSGEQTIIGPVIVATFEHTQLEQFVDAKDNKTKHREVLRSFNRVILPQVLDITSALDTQYRQLGIYKALTYQSNNQLLGTFKVPESWWQHESATLKRINMVLAISDVRGINNGLTATLNDKTFELLPGTGLKQLGNGAHIAIDPQWLATQSVLDFKLALNLQGMQRLKFTPVGKETTVAIESNWPHPNFVGNYLPNTPSIDENGFAAVWQTTFFSTNLPEIIKSCVNSRKCDALYETTLGVSLVDPVNQYLKTDRAIKYAELFILLTLFAFMLFEIFKKLAIHPIQYSLVGIAMALFYLLLLSLSEHIDFDLAYLISSISCAGVLGVYITGVLGQARLGMLFCGGILTLYLILFGLLAAEDFALLMGSLFVFIVLSALMIATRKIDWYQLTNNDTND